MNDNTKENLTLFGVVAATVAAVVGASVLDEKAGGPKYRKAQRKRDEERREALRSEIEKRQQAHRRDPLSDLIDHLVQGRSSSSDIVERIQKMDGDYSRRRLLKDWVQSGRRLDPIEAADIREAFDWIRREDNDLLSVACGIPRNNRRPSVRVS